MFNFSNKPALPAPQFITVPLTGIQVCRRLPLRHLSEAGLHWLAWRVAKSVGRAPSCRTS